MMSQPTRQTPQATASASQPGGEGSQEAAAEEARERAEQDLDAAARRLEAAYPDFNTGWGTALVPLRAGTELAWRLVRPPSR